MKHTIIIGGGISGLCTAYYLVEAGHRVTVIDRGDISGGASFINAGYLTPSHFISLAAPGMVARGLKWMFDSRSPLYIRPRWDMDFLRWGLLFSRSATAKKVEASIPVLKALNLRSRELYEELYTTSGFDFQYHRDGVLMVYATEKEGKEELKLAERAVREGLEVNSLDAGALKALQPVFSDKALGAVHYLCDRHITPNEFMGTLRKWLEDKGVSFVLGQEVKAIRASGNRITAVHTTSGGYTAENVVLAAGSWTFELARKLRLYIPVQGGKGYSMDVRRPTGISIPAILAEARVAVTPMNGFTRFAGSMEFSGNNDIIRKERVQAIADAVTHYYNDIEISEGEKSLATSGLRPVSPDGLPYIGKSRIYSNLVVATGHAMMGFSMGPVTGKLVAQVINGEKTDIDLKPLRPERFRGY
ncbi:NAD(P)/FAD-dependent oxidoreductase [Sinomicrobium soli]|uniref:NAD(P)/FAD-dependent oxidoreductase n=1 Tax=Sinomicrobium sp. N-1-3-6 TaxID=2219864 RepID=UPI001F22C301|nr:FAD-dependent oxidoreductase [Sinomicrobium sp. N-1-3-6]